VVNGDVETNVYGGSFLTYDSKTLINGIAGGPRNGILYGNVVLNIYGGNFVGQVSGGTFLGSADYANRLINGSTELNIYGGIFQRSIFACSPTSTVTATGGSEINVIQTEGKELAFYASMLDCTTFAGNGEAIKIGKNTVIVAESASGTISLTQTQGWLAHDYFTILSGKASFENITKTTDAFGSWTIVTPEAGNTDYVAILCGVGATPSGTTLILDEKLTVRVLFDPEEIAEYGSDFTFSAVMDGKTLTAQYEKYVLDGTTYDSWLLKGIGLGDFTKLIEVTGGAMDPIDFTVVSLADEGAAYYEESDETTAQLFRSIADLGRKANGLPADYDLVVNAVNWTAPKAPEALDDRLSMKTMSLIMTDAIGVRLTGETVAADTPLKIFVNGTDVTEKCVITRTEIEGKFTFTADMYVKVAMMTGNLNIVITDDADNAMFTMTIRVDALAEKIAAQTGNELSSYALQYVQAADAYVKAKEANA
jgi:hypothetical protein